MLIVVVALPILAGLLLQVGFVQNYAVDRLTRWLTEKSGTTITIDHVNIAFFNRAVLEGVYVQDPQVPQDTLLYAQRLSVGIDGINFFNGNTALGAVSLSDGVLHVAKDSTGVTNLKRVIDRFKPEVPRKIRLHLSARELNLIGMRFTLRDYAPPVREHGVNFRDLDLQTLHFQARGIAVRGDSVACRIEHLTFHEKSGFYLQHLTSEEVSVGQTGVRFADLSVETPLSVLQFDRLNLLYDDWSAFRDFAHQVRLDVALGPSTLAYRTLAAFSKKPTSIRLALGMESAVVQGPVSSLHGQIHSARTGGTQLDASFEVTGLPDVSQTWLRVQVERLETDAQSILATYSDVSDGRSPGRLAPILERAGQVRFTGTFDGLLKDFKATGLLTTALGSARAELKFMSATQPGAVRLQGRVETEEFRLGELLGSGQLGLLSLSAQVDALARMGELSLTTDAEIGRLDFKNYTYSGIRMDGRFAGRTFEGRISSSDPNLDFVTSGRFSLAEDVPAYDFEMDLNNADLVALKLNRRDSVSRLAMRFRAHATGTTLDNINGTAAIDSLSYVNHIDTVHTGVIHFEAQNTPQSKRLIMRSDFADSELRGSNSYNHIFRFFGQTLKQYLPSMPAGTASPIAGEGTAAEEQTEEGSQPSPVERDPAGEGAEAENGYYLVKLNVKQANNVAAIFVPGLEIAEGSSLAFLFNPYLNDFSLSVKSDYILQRQFYVGNLVVECRNQADSVSIYASADQFGVGNIDLPNLSVVGGIRDNRIALATRFRNPDNGANALISTSTTFGRSVDGLPQMDVALNPTTFFVGGQLWYITPSHVVLDSTGIDFHRFRLWGEGQELSINGRASASEEDTLQIRMQNFDLSPLTRLVSRQGYRVAGRMGGDATFVAPLGAMQFQADMTIDSLALNDYALGTVDFRSEWDRPRRWVRFTASTRQGETPISGVYDSRGKRYRVDFNFPRFDMALLEPLLQGVLIQTAGTANTKLTMTGGPEGGPLLNGTIQVENYEATVDYTRARYRLAGPVTVRNNRFELPEVPISDGNGGGGVISAWFDSQYFRHLRFGVKIDFRDMLCLNTSAGDNPDFYGKMYGTGAFSVTGDDFKTMLDVRAETARSSTFVLPLSDVSTIAEADFISFARPKPEQEERPADHVAAFRRNLQQAVNRRRTKSELNVNLNVSVLPNTEGQIVMDPKLGDAIKGRGNGRFRINVVPDRDIFTMDGQFDISEGTYLYTLYGVLANKYFVIQPGSSIQWMGDPTDPLVNIDAVYRVRTSLKPLLGETQGSNTGNGNVNVNCGIHLTDRLFNPTVQLSITAPGADPETKNLLRNLLNTEESTTMQFAYLMLSNSFMPDDQTNAIGTMSGSLAGIAGLEFLSNQISNLISGSNYNIRFGYRPQSELTSEEVTFDVGADIIANKLSVEVGGNYDVGQRGAYTTTNNPLSVDGYVTWVLNKSGSLKLKGFTRTIDRFDESQGLQDNGVGIYYRQEFQSWKDLQQRYRAWREAVRLRRAVRQEKRFEKRQLKKAGRFEPEDTSGSVPEEAKDTVAVDAVLPSDTTRVGAPVSGDGARRVK